MRIKYPAFVPWCALCLCTWSSRAWAGDTALAEALFNQGRALMDQGRYDEACQKFVDSYEQDRAVGTQLNLANCREKQGKTASAWAEYAAAAAAARDAGQTDRQEHAQQKMKQLEGKLIHLIVTVPEQWLDKELSITLDDNALPRSAWGSPLPVDPGSHRLKVTAPGYETKIIEVQTQASTTVTIPDLAPAPESSAPDSSAGASSANVTLDAKKPGNKTLGWVGVGVGGAAVAAGVVTLVIGKSAESKLEDDCIGSRCPPSSQGDIDRAETFQTVSLVSFIVGGLALAGGITLLATAPTAEQRSSGSVRAFIGHRSAGLEGTF